MIAVVASSSFTLIYHIACMYRIRCQKQHLETRVLLSNVFVPKMPLLNVKWIDSSLFILSTTVLSLFFITIQNWKCLFKKYILSIYVCSGSRIHNLSLCYTLHIVMENTKSEAQFCRKNRGLQRTYVYPWCLIFILSSPQRAVEKLWAPK